MSCLFPLAVLGVIVFVAIIAGRRSPATDATGENYELWRARQEIASLDYMLQQLSDSVRDETIDLATYEKLRARCLDRRSALAGLWPAASYSNQPSPPTPDVNAAEATPSSASRPVAPLPVGPTQPLTLAVVAKWLLILGVFLLLAAAIIFTVYRWQTFSDTAKFLILVSVTLLFYASAALVKVKLKLEGGALAFALVAAGMTLLDCFIYLNSKNLLSDYLPLAIAFLISAAVFMAATWMLRYRTMFYLSLTAQAAAIFCLNGFLTKAATSLGSNPLTSGPLGVLLLALAGAWLALATLPAIRSREIAYRFPLFVAGNTLLVASMLAHAARLIINFTAQPGVSAGIYWLNYGYEAMLLAIAAWLFFVTRHRLYLVAGITVLAGLVLNTMAFAVVDARFIPFALSLTVLGWLCSAWLLRLFGKLTELAQTLLQTGMTTNILLAGFFGLFYLAILEVDPHPYAFAYIITFLIIGIGFILASAFLNEPALMFPAPYLLAFFVHLVLLRSGVSFQLIATAIALLAIMAAGIGYIGNRRRWRIVETPYLAAAYGLGLYALTVSLWGHEPAVIAALSLGAAMYISLALILRNNLLKQISIQGGLIQLTLAVIVTLSYRNASMAVAVVSIAAIYLGAFISSSLIAVFSEARAAQWIKGLLWFAVGLSLTQLMLYTTTVTAQVPQVPWLYDPVRGVDILMSAYIVAGVFLVAAAYMHEEEPLEYLGYLAFLGAYIVKIANLNVSYIEWYFIPIGLFILMMGYLLFIRHKAASGLLLSNGAGLTALLLPSTLAFMSTAPPEAQHHALIAGTIAVIFLFIGMALKTRVFFFGAILFLVWNVFYQTWEFIYALPKWATIGGLGLILILLAIFIQVRREAVIAFYEQKKHSLADSWK